MITKANGTHGAMSRGLRRGDYWDRGQPVPVPVTLPNVRWLLRPDVPAQVEIMGKLKSGKQPVEPDDRTLIQECAEAVKLALMSNAVRAILEAGEQLKNLYDRLAKRNRYDNTHLGWKQAFTLKPNPFPFNRCTADRLILIYKFFADWDATPLEALPCHHPALWVLALYYKDPKLIAKLVAEGKIHPLIGKTALYRMGREVGVVTTEGTGYRNLHCSMSSDLLAASKAERVAAILEAMAKLKVTLDDLDDDERMPRRVVLPWSPFELRL